MKTEFTKEFMTSNRGCYSREKMLNVKCVEDDNITLENLFNDLPINDFAWFFVRKCELTLIQKQRFALQCAKVVLPIFEKYNPNDKRVRECIDATGLFLDGKLTKDELIIKRRAAVAAVDAVDAAAAASAGSYTYADAAYADAAAAYAAVVAAAYADAYDAADSYAYAAAYAAVYADAAAYAAFRKSVWEFVRTL